MALSSCAITSSIVRCCGRAMREVGQGRCRSGGLLMASYNTLGGTRWDRAIYGMVLHGRRASPSPVWRTCLTVRITCLACRTVWKINTPAVASVAAKATNNKTRCCLFGIGYAAEPQRPRAVLGRRHQQIFSVFIQFVRLREIPVRTLRLIIAAATQDGRACVLVFKLVGPLPHVADQVHDSERARSRGMRVDIGGLAVRTSVVRRWRR